MVYAAGGAGESWVMAPAPWAGFDVIIYDRDTGADLARRIEACRAFAAEHGLRITEVLVDEELAAKTDGPSDWPWKRPALEKGFRIVEGTPGTVLLVHSPERLSSYVPSLRMMALRHSKQILIARTGEFLTADGVR